MTLLSGSRSPMRGRARGLDPLAPLRLVGAVVGAALLALVALATLGIALLFLRGRGGRNARVFTWRVGGPGPRAGVDAAPGAEPPRVDAAESADDDASAAPPRRERSYAEVVEALPLVAALSLALALGGAAAPAPAHARLLVPMDERQTDHLKAYGLTYWVLTRGQKAEWLLNYRGGSFLLADDPETLREANVRGVTTEDVSGADEAAIRATIADENMEAVALEKAPRIAVYIAAQRADRGTTRSRSRSSTPTSPTTTVWDQEVLRRQAVEVRLAPPAPRGLHRPVRQVLPRLPRLPLVSGGGGAEDDGHAHGLREGDAAQAGDGRDHPRLHRARRIHVRHVLGHRHLRHRAGRRRGGHRGRGVRRAIPRSRRRRVGSTTRARSRSRTSTSTWTRSCTASRTST